jgi:uncharacterized protein YozE (UPF0346 family)
VFSPNIASAWSGVPACLMVRVHTLDYTTTTWLEINVSIHKKSQLSYVFLVCSERSGSNLIREIIGGHSKVYAPPSLHIGRHLGARFYHYVLGDRNSKLQSLVKTELAKRIGRHFGPDKERDFKDFVEKRNFHDFCDIFDEIYSFLSSGNGKNTIFIKENNIYEQLPYIFHHFPDSKFIFQVRDPRDYFASVQSLKSGWLKSKYGTSRYALDVWRSDQICGLNLLAHLGPERVYFQRYEDLLQNSTGVLGGVCDFLGLEYEPDMLLFHQRDSVKEMSKKNLAWQNLKYPILDNNIGKFRSNLSSFQVKIVETYLGDLMDIFGYDRLSPRLSKPSFSATMFPCAVEPIERFRNQQVVPYPLFGGESFISRLKEMGQILRTPYK